MVSKRGPKMCEPTHEQVYQFVREHHKPFVTSSDVSEQFSNVSGRTIRKRLNDLTDQGKLKRREVGASAVLWYIEN